ncbi:MAG: glycosyltransferase family 4 protein [Alphaproteobacteria bacterium]|nr:glycosyltransferase family 4 protein [Alphaproteobacteria bacterium]MBU2418714.1 glycosyltransferase family 4 protein [Alphaproteobacteria bacterium]
MSLPPDFTVLQVTPELNSGGVEQATLDVNRALAAAGARSVVASEGGRLEQRVGDDGGRLVRVPVASKNPLTILANAGRLAEIARREGVDVIHVRSRAPALSALIAARRTGLPLVSTYHGIYSARNGLKRAYNSLMTRADLVIANSGFTRDHILAEHGVDPARVALVPEAVDAGRFNPEAADAGRIAALRAAWGLSPDDDRRIALLPGRLTGWKGQRVLIEAWAAARPPMVLILAGDDQGRTAYRAELEAMIAANGLEDAVRIVGEVADMPAAYLAAEVICTPSLEAESFGRTAVEAQMMGRPVWASDLGASRETVDPAVGGDLVSPGDVAAWTVALQRIAQTPTAELRAMGERAGERARRLYAFDAMVAATFAVYRRAVDRAAS